MIGLIRAGISQIDVVTAGYQSSSRATSNHNIAAPRRIVDAGTRTEESVSGSSRVFLARIAAEEGVEVGRCVTKARTITKERVLGTRCISFARAPAKEGVGRARCIIEASTSTEEGVEFASIIDAGSLTDECVVRPSDTEYTIAADVVLRRRVDGANHIQLAARSTRPDADVAAARNRHPGVGDAVSEEENVVRGVRPKLERESRAVDVGRLTIAGRRVARSCHAPREVLARPVHGARHANAGLRARSVGGVEDRGGGGAVIVLDDGQGVNGTCRSYTDVAAAGKRIGLRRRALRCDDEDYQREDTPLYPRSVFGLKCFHCDALRYELLTIQTYRSGQSMTAL